jgi:hypothetical protein
VTVIQDMTQRRRDAMLPGRAASSPVFGECCSESRVAGQTNALGLLQRRAGTVK